MEKFHYCLYGKEFTLENDHKPLVSIYKKHMIDISPRVQRLIVRSLPYLPFKDVYKKGTDIPVADALSHLTPMDPEDNIQLPIIAVSMITTWILMSVESQGSFSNKLDQLRKSAAQDEQLTRLKGYISTGFPCHKNNLLTDLHEFWPYKEMLSIESGLITCGNRIIVPKEMRPEMLQYVHEGHQGKERCLLRARNTVFWPKMTYDVQQLIEKCIICQEHGKSQPIIGTTQELPPFPWHTLAIDMFYWKRMDFLIVVDVFSKYIIVRKLPNSTSAVICTGLSMIVTKLGPPHIIRSDNGPCYNSKEFQQFLQCYITHQTSSPNHPRSNGFVERMVGVAKKLMDKAGKEGKPWISGLFDYRVTPQSGSIASPLQLLTWCTPREKNLPQLPSTLGAQEMYQTCQELMKRQGNKPEKSYIELTPGTPVWVHHRQNATWEPATVINQCAPNSYWIMQENGTEQPKVYRCTGTMLKIRSTPTEVKQTGHMKDWSTESRKSESNISAIPKTVRDSVHENSQENVSPDPVQSSLPRLDLPQAPFDSEDREEIAESLCTDETALETPETNGQNTPYTPGFCKSTRTLEN